MASAIAGRDLRRRPLGSAAHLARPPIVATWSISWNASCPRWARATWPTIANIGVESWRAVWMPIARFAAPTARVPRQAAGRPGQLAVGLGHERRRTLVAGGDDADAGVAEGVEEAEERLAGHREGVADAGAAQGVGDEAPDGPRPGVGRRPPPRRRDRLLGSLGPRVGGSVGGARRGSTGASAGSRAAPPEPRSRAARSAGRSPLGLSGGPRSAASRARLRIAGGSPGASSGGGARHRPGRRSARRASRSRAQSCASVDPDRLRTHRIDERPRATRPSDDDDGRRRSSRSWRSGIRAAPSPQR